MACVVGWWRGFLDRLLSLALKGTEHLALFSFPAPTAQVGVLFQPSLSGQVTLGTGTAYCHQSDQGCGQTSLTNPGRQADPIRQDGQPQRCRRAGPGLWLPSGPLPATSAPAASCRCSPGASEGEMGGVTRLAAVATESPPCTPPASPGRTGQSELGREGRECLGGPPPGVLTWPQGEGWVVGTDRMGTAGLGSKPVRCLAAVPYTCMQTHPCVCTPPHTYTHVHALTLTHPPIYTLTHIRTHTNAHMYTLSHSHTCFHTHTNTYMCTLTRIYAHTHCTHPFFIYTLTRTRAFTHLERASNQLTALIPPLRRAVFRRDLEFGESQSRSCPSRRGPSPGSGFGRRFWRAWSCSSEPSPRPTRIKAQAPL